MVERPQMQITPGETTRIADIERTLTNLWSQIAEAEGETAVLRATTLNLVLYTKNPQGAPGLIGQVSETHPSRAIVINVDTNAPGALVASPNVFCRPALGGTARTQVCCEAIEIVAGQDAVGGVSAAVQALLLPDMPVYLYCQGNVMRDDSVLEPMIESIDGLIVDSDTFDDIPTAFRNLAALREIPYFRAVIADLNWQRLLPWRKQLAQVFDSNTTLPLIPAIHQVEIVHRDGRAQALLLLGWLISRLGWRLDPGGDSNTWVAQSSQNHVMLRLLPVDDGTPGLQRVTVTAADHPFTVAYSEDCSCLIAHDGRNAALRLPPTDEGSLISRILDVAGQDRVFDDALSIALALATEIRLLSERAGVIVATNPAALAKQAARYFVLSARHAIERRGRFTVALSGGSTPKTMDELLARWPYREQIEWSKVHFFWGDERNVAIDHPDSNERMARDALLSQAPVPPRNIHWLLAGQLPADETAARYAVDIREFFQLQAGELPMFDLVLLGLGEDGHTASLFPHTAALEADPASIFVANPVPQLNTIRLTLTAGTINNAASVVFLVSGAAKADIVYRVFKGPVQPDVYPAQLIQPAAGSLMVIADQKAAAKLYER
jgi:6-phosphogluconolactonase